MEDKLYCIYIATNPHNTVLYTGVTSNLPRRMWEHKSKLVEGFTKKYNVIKLVYYEVCDTPYNAIEREKKIKGLLRSKKIALVNSMNPTWKDLADEL